MAFEENITSLFEEMDDKLRFVYLTYREDDEKLR